MAVDYLGFVKVGDRTPLLVRAPEEERDQVRKTHAREKVIFTQAQDMPSLEELLAAHEVDYAVLQLPAPLADDTAGAPTMASADWKQRAKARLDRAVEDAPKGDAIFEEDLSFVPALLSEDLDRFLDEAHAFLGRNDATEEAWNAFLLEADLRSALGDPPVLDNLEEGPIATEGPRPLFWVEDLGLQSSRGAIGGPRPLAHGD
jgi:hypothetical protein